MDLQKTSAFTFGVATSLYAAPHSKVFLPQEFRVLDEDGDDLIGPEPGVCFYNRVQTPHGWVIGRLSAIAKISFGVDRVAPITEARPTTPPKLSSLAAVADTLSPYPITAGTARVNPGNVRGVDEPVIEFTNSDDGLPYAIPTDLLVAVFKGITDDTGELS